MIPESCHEAIAEPPVCWESSELRHLYVGYGGKRRLSSSPKKTSYYKNRIPGPGKTPSRPPSSSNKPGIRNPFNLTSPCPLGAGLRGHLTTGHPTSTALRPLASFAGGHTGPVLNHGWLRPRLILLLGVALSHPRSPARHVQEKRVVMETPRRGKSPML